MDDPRAVQGKTRDDPALHEVDDDGVQSDLDGMGAHAEHDRPLVLSRLDHGGRYVLEVFRREDVRQGRKKIQEAPALWHGALQNRRSATLLSRPLSE